MRPRLTSSARFPGNRVGGLLLLAAATPLLIMPALAHAQHADAGTEHRALPPPPVPPLGVRPPKDPAATNEPSGVLPKAIDPTQLSEATRARLAERAAGQHASSIPAQTPNPRTEAEPAAGAVPAVPPFRPRLDIGEPLRRGQARPRVLAVETREGVTLLSNRIQISEARLSAALAKRPLPRPEPEASFADEPVAADDSSEVTETHSLRPMSSRSTKTRDVSTGIGWLLWPFVLFVTAGAVVGTLWFRNKTE